MELNYSIIGMRLKQARIDKKLTQEDLAEKLDVSVTYISRVERGTTQINLKRLSEICRCFRNFSRRNFRGRCSSWFFLLK